MAFASRHGTQWSIANRGDLPPDFPNVLLFDLILISLLIFMVLARNVTNRNIEGIKFAIAELERRGIKVRLAEQLESSTSLTSSSAFR